MARDPAADGDGFREAAQVSFHANAIGVTVRMIGIDGLVAAGVADAEWFAAERRHAFADLEQRIARASARLAVCGDRSPSASLRSVWTVNSLRGAIALAAAVAVADLTSVQHGFWVVLGTLSVLRTNAASTGATALRAIPGRRSDSRSGAAAGRDRTGSWALWAALPGPVLITAYAPGTLPFTVGQAAFTVTSRCCSTSSSQSDGRSVCPRRGRRDRGAVSVVVGRLLWPHGVATLVAQDLADAFRSGADT